MGRSYIKLGYGTYYKLTQSGHMPLKDLDLVKEKMNGFKAWTPFLIERINEY